MHKRFVIANGGNFLADDEIELVRKSVSERVKAESTLEVTKKLLLEGEDVRRISSTRSLAETTIWGHVEKLVLGGELTAEQIKHLEPTDIDWVEAKMVLDNAMATHGTEKLKPIYEEAGEKYDYNLVRLARMQFVLEKSDNKDVSENV